MIATAEFERDAAEMENDFQVSAAFSGFVITGSEEPYEYGLSMADAGYDPRRRTKLVCRISQFPGSVPVVNDLITLRDLLWRVENAPEFSPDGINVSLPLVQSN